MADSEYKVFMFKGGSRDGETIKGSNFSVGVELRRQPADPKLKVEIYRLHDDGCFHFNRYGIAFNPRLDSDESLEELTPIIAKLGDVLKELDAHCDKYGGPSAEDTSVGNWRLRHKDA